MAKEKTKLKMAYKLLAHYDCPNTASQTNKRVVKLFCDQCENRHCNGLFGDRSHVPKCWEEYSTQMLRHKWKRKKNGNRA